VFGAFFSEISRQRNMKTRKNHSTQKNNMTLFFRRGLLFFPFCPARFSFVFLGIARFFFFFSQYDIFFSAITNLGAFFFLFQRDFFQRDFFFSSSANSLFQRDFFKECAPNTIFLKFFLARFCFFGAIYFFSSSCSFATDRTKLNRRKKKKNSSIPKKRTTEKTNPGQTIILLNIPSRTASNTYRDRRLRAARFGYFIIQLPRLDSLSNSSQIIEPIPEVPASN